MMWIFEWDIVTGDSAALDSIYEVSRDDLDEAIADGDAGGRGRRADARAGRGDRPGDLALPRAVPVVRRRARLRDRPAGHARRLPRDGAAARGVARHRPRDRARRVAGRRARRTARPAPRTSSGTRGDVDLPAYNFTAADLGSDRADRDPAMAWLARVCSSRSLRRPGARARRRAACPARRRCGRCGVAATRPWRLGEVPAPASRVRPGGGAGRCPRSCWWPAGCVFTWFAAPAHLVVDARRLAAVRGRAALGASAAATRSTCGRRSAAWCCCAR